jgi:hypothetical protein
MEETESKAKKPRQKTNYVFSVIKRTPKPIGSITAPIHPQSTYVKGRFKISPRSLQHLPTRHMAVLFGRSFSPLMNLNASGLGIGLTRRFISSSPY